MKIGLYGGTFNPPHNTHVNIVRQAVEQLGLDKLIVIPAGLPPHKFCAMDKQARYDMACLAFDGIAEVSDVELNRTGKTYTSDTVKYFARLYPQAQLFFLVGGDSLEHFAEWHCPEEILRYVTLAVAARGHELTSEQAKKFRSDYGCDYAEVVVTPDDVGSTEIRLRYNFGLDVTDVPPVVDEYIRKNGLYTEYLPLATKLRTYLTDKRFLHTFYVVKRGLELARDEERDKVFVACLLHDCAKYIAPDNYPKYGFVCPSNMPSSVVHAFLGKLVARQDFGIEDEEILDAIEYHCTAKPDMSRLAKIVYVADKTEQTRPYPTAHLLVGTLDDMFVNCLVEANDYCLKNHVDDVYPLTLQALRYYAPQVCETMNLDMTVSKK